MSEVSTQQGSRSQQSSILGLPTARICFKPSADTKGCGYLRFAHHHQFPFQRRPVSSYPLPRCLVILSWRPSSLCAPSSGSLGLLLCQLPHLLGSGVQAREIRALYYRVAVDRDLLPVLEEHEGGHGGDAVLLSDRTHVVDVDLSEGEEAGDRPLRRHRDEVWRDGLAGPAPVGIEIDDDVARGREERVELAV
ncbi:hypothetical protein VTI74DRAFT_9843 [Chaetomium olivicolor]